MGRRSEVLAVALVASCTFGSDVGGSGGGDGDGDETGDGGTTGAPGTGGSDGGSSDTNGGGTTVGLDGGETGSGSSGGAGTGTGTGTGTEGTETGTGSDGETETGTTTGGPPSGAFGEPVRIDELSDDFAFDDDPCVRFDDLEIFFNSNRTGGFEIWTATRDDPDDLWDPPVLVTELNSAVGDTTPKLSENGLVMVLSSDRSPSVSNDLWVSMRDDFDSPWSDPVHFPDASSVLADFGGTPVGDALYVCSNRADGQGLVDIWRIPNVDFSGPSADPAVNETALNTEGDDCTLSIRADGLELFWEHRPVIGVWGVWTATRDAVGEPWDDIAEAAVINSEVDDNDPWVLADGHRLYFASLREGASDLYVAER